MFRRLCLLALCLLLLPLAPALADDVCVIDSSAFAAGVETDKNYVSIICPVETESPVLVSIYQRDGSLTWQRDYGMRSSPVKTEDIYLRLQGVSTTYHAEIRVADTVIRFPIVRKLARLRHNAACTAGYPLRSITGRDTWESVTLLDVRATAGAAAIVPVYASEAYHFGTASMTVLDGALTVSISPAAHVDGTVDSAKVYVAASTATAAQFGQPTFTGTIGALNQPIRLPASDIIAVYVELDVSFDPATVPIGAPEFDPQQIVLWQQLLPAG